MKNWKTGDRISPDYLNELEQKAAAYDKLLEEQEAAEKAKAEQEAVEKAKKK